jgi:hypothetical protein
MHDRPPTRGEHILTVLACVACSVVIGAAYTVVASSLAMYAPFPLNGWGFVILASACTVALGIGIGHRRPRAVLTAAAVVSILSSAIYALMLALPAFSPTARNIYGLINFALTQATVTFFIVGFFAFPGALVGLLASYFWHDR